MKYDFDSSKMQSVLSTEFKEDTMWFHIKAYDPSIEKTYTFWLGGDSEKEIRKILKNKKITKIEWIREETPPFIGDE